MPRDRNGSAAAEPPAPAPDGSLHQRRSALYSDAYALAAITNPFRALQGESTAWHTESTTWRTEAGLCLSWEILKLPKGGWGAGLLA